LSEWRVLGAFTGDLDCVLLHDLLEKHLSQDEPK